MDGTKRISRTITKYKGEVMKIQPVNYIKTQIEWVKSFLSEPDGKGSNKRLISFAVVGSYLFAYIKTTLFTNKIEDIPPVWALTIGSILGLGIIDVVAKNYIKKTVDPPTNNGNTNANNAS